LLACATQAAIPKSADPFGTVVPSVTQKQIRNRLLAALSPDDFALVGPHLEPVSLAHAQAIGQPDEPCDFVWFLASGIVSQIAVPQGGRQIEVGIYGREGVGPTAPLLGADRGPYLHVVQGEATAFRITAEGIQRSMRQSASLQALLLRYVQAFTTQVAFTAVSNASNLVGGRLARWLLMCHDRHDRLDGGTLTLTHEFLGAMLSVRRSGVTDAIHILEGEGAIKATRGRIQVLDRERLRLAAGTSYGVPEAEYERLIGPCS
jgi:CRP-like cAMP-binding protein